VRRFNAQDVTASERYLAPDLRVWNDSFYYTGIDGMKAHYAKIWKTFIETLNIKGFVSDGSTTAVELVTDFYASCDADETLAGAVKQGDYLQFHGVVLYEEQDGRFTSIEVAYLSSGMVAPNGVLIPRTV
jgi:hypothetical protein